MHQYVLWTHKNALQVNVLTVWSEQTAQDFLHSAVRCAPCRFSTFLVSRNLYAL